MKSLDDQIADIEKLNGLRQRARTLQQEAIEALTERVYVPQPRPRKGTHDVAKANRPNWALPGDDVEKAEMLQALARFRPKGEESKARWEESRKALIEDLTGITYEDCLAASKEAALDSVPIFRCALVLQSLAKTPGHVLSKAALACFYCVVQELNQVAGPAWTGGAARASDEAMPTAFITGECARGLLALEHALIETAKAAELLGKEAARASKFPTDFKLWQDQEEKFRTRSLRVLLAMSKPHLIIALSEEKKTAKELLDAIEQALRDIPKIKSLKLPERRVPEAPDPADRMGKIVPLHFVETAKDIAWHAVNQLLQALREPIANRDPEALGKGIANKLKNGAQIIRDLLEPVEQFAESVIDRQLAATSPSLGLWVDGAELVFAATLLGIISNWNRPKARAAYDVVRPLLSVNGRLLSIRPFDVQEKGYRLNAQTLEVTRRLADLVAHLDVEPEPEFVERLMLPFDYTRMPGVKKSECGWMADPAGRNSNSLWWLTAIAVDALDSVIRMLDEIINRQVLQHFQVRKPSSLKLTLDELFYPDFGLAASRGMDNIAVKLQQLRAHAGNGPVEADRLFSLILYGPPGTGKTTLVEAVAKSAGVPLVDITPSDILVGGAEGVERRTRHVFQALSKLTHAVILFDEFDSILLDRAKRDPDEIPRSVIEFLTPGMLPKLKALNEASKEQRISFVLATNFVDRLDAAVTRGGRFDDRHGIYPPDVASRLGRLLDQLKKLESELKNKVKAKLQEKEIQLTKDINEEPDAQRKQTLEEKLKTLQKSQQPDSIHFRVLDAVKSTRSAPMDKLGKPGWHTEPREDKDFDSTLFGYIFTNVKNKPVEPEARYEIEKEKYDKQRLNKEKELVNSLVQPKDSYWTDWEKIERWDTEFTKKMKSYEETGTTPDLMDVFQFLQQLMQGSAR